MSSNSVVIPQFQHQQVLPLHNHLPTLALDISPDGAKLLSGGGDDQMHLLSLKGCLPSSAKGEHIDESRGLSNLTHSKALNAAGQ
jgi:hypothetical protein